MIQFKMKTFYFYFFNIAFLLTFLSAIFPHGNIAMAQPLYTNSRWMVDESGHRVKLACVSWEAHLETAVPEGLNRQPVDELSLKILSMGFNCVRLTWPLFLATNDTLANSVTVRQSLQRFGLNESIAGLQAINPSIIDLSLMQAFKAVVSSLGKYKIMVILDNHISRPGDCCSADDGNGFFGDQDFDADLWITGLRRMATHFNGTTHVVGMSLRNELRGSRQNVDVWYRYMQRGAEEVHAANPDVLVILSGLSFDRDLTFIRTRPLTLSFTGKIVFEIHMRSDFFPGEVFEKGNLNKVCGEVMHNFSREAGFLLELGWPLFVSEFEVDQTGQNVTNSRFIQCFLSIAAELDLDWALWTLAGSYYRSGGEVGRDQKYGILSWNWCEIRNCSFLQRISALQPPFRGPGLSHTCCPHKVIFHPLTGLCVLKKSPMEPLSLGPCTESEAWTYSPMKTLSVKDTHSCLHALGVGMPVKLGSMFFGFCSQWSAVSDSKMHLATHISHNDTPLCLDVHADNHTIVTNCCKCLCENGSCDPSSQWFKLVDSTRVIRTMPYHTFHGYELWSKTSGFM